MPAQKDRLFRSANPTIILGSKSSIRRELLGELGELHGFSYSVKTADIDEKAIRLEKSEDLVVSKNK
jgi:septum formation protein